MGCLVFYAFDKRKWSAAAARTPKQIQPPSITTDIACRRSRSVAKLIIFGEAGGGGRFNAMHGHGAGPNR